MNLPNKLTIFRIILVPIMVIIPFLNIQGEVLGIPITYLIIDLIFIIASITDKLDGTIARSRNMVTTFGKFLDPIADKILVLAALIMLVDFGKIPAWIPIIILFREFAVSGYRLIASQNMIAIILCFVDKFSFGDFIFRVSNEADAVISSVGIYMTSGQFVINILSTVMLLICVIATIFSGWDYLKGGKELLKDK